MEFCENDAAESLWCLKCSPIYTSQENFWAKFSNHFMHQHS